MFSARTLVALAVFALALAGVAWGQSVTVEDQFASYHQSLRGMADEILSVPTEGRSTIAVTSAGDSPDEQRFVFDSALDRVRQLRPLLEPILREEGLPGDLTAVVLVESGGRTRALSPKGALGLWQLMPETARRYGLTVSPGRDDRTDPIKSSRAAVRYLRALYLRFGDWRLALAAYNAGEQAVRRAIARSASNDFQRLSLFLPDETRAYVPAVMTARPLFAAGSKLTGATLQAARRADVVYASARLDN